MENIFRNLLLAIAAAHARANQHFISAVARHPNIRYGNVPDPLGEIGMTAAGAGIFDANKVPAHADGCDAK